MKVAWTGGGRQQETKFHVRNGRIDDCVTKLRVMALRPGLAIDGVPVEREMYAFPGTHVLTPTHPLLRVQRNVVKGDEPTVDRDVIEAPVATMVMAGAVVDPERAKEVNAAFDEGTRACLAAQTCLQNQSIVRPMDNSRAPLVVRDIGDGGIRVSSMRELWREVPGEGGRGGWRSTVREELYAALTLVDGRIVATVTS